MTTPSIQADAGYGQAIGLRVRDAAWMGDLDAVGRLAVLGNDAASGFLRPATGRSRGERGEIDSVLQPLLVVEKVAVVGPERREADHDGHRQSGDDAHRATGMPEETPPAHQC